MIGQFYNSKRILRIIAPDGSTEEFELNTKDEAGNPLNNISSVLTYDVELREEAPFTIAREATNRLLSEIIKSVPESARVLLIPFIRNMPIQNKDFLISKLEAIFDQTEAQAQETEFNEQIINAGLQPTRN